MDEKINEAVPLWRGRKERPPSDAEGWFDEGNPPLTHKAWRNPETGEVEWRDYPNQSKGRPSIDHYWIASGVQDLDPEPTEEFPRGGPWNSIWTPAEGYNEWTDEIGFERIRAYSGSRPFNMSNWPKEYRDAWYETHDQRYGLE